MTTDPLQAAPMLTESHDKFYGVAWLHQLCHRAGKGVLNNVDARGVWRCVSELLATIDHLKSSAERAGPEQLPLPELLAERDRFIVSKGLWQEFVDSLPPASVVSAPAPGEPEDKMLYTLRLAHYWANGGFPAQARDVLRNALAAQGDTVGGKFAYDYAGYRKSLPSAEVVDTVSEGTMEFLELLEDAAALHPIPTAPVEPDNRDMFGRTPWEADDDGIWEDPNMGDQ